MCEWEALTSFLGKRLKYCLTADRVWVACVWVRGVAQMSMNVSTNYVYAVCLAF